MCNCIEDSKKELIKHITENSQMKGFKIHEADFENVPMVFDLAELKMFTEFKYRYSFSKADGTLSKVHSDTKTVYFNYCPFCGKKYDT